jgi:hypothetical protein
VPQNGWLSSYGCNYSRDLVRQKRPAYVLSFQERKSSRHLGKSLSQKHSSAGIARFDFLGVMATKGGITWRLPLPAATAPSQVFGVVAAGIRMRMQNALPAAMALSRVLGVIAAGGKE